MLNITPQAQHTSANSPNVHPTSNIDAAEVRKTLREQWPTIVLLFSLSIFAALIYVLTARPIYTAKTDLMLDTRKNQILQNQQVIGDQQIDVGMVESQVEILKSEGTASSVIRELKLIDEPEFARPASTAIGAIVSAVTKSSHDTLSLSQSERRAIAIFQSNLTVRRIGLTYVLEVSYASANPALAARIANGVADAYMVGELEARYQATKRASKWLQDRIEELRLQAQIAEQAVQGFKSANDIVGTNRGLMSDQQLGDVNAQLVTARAATAEAKARLDRIQEISRGDFPNATVTDALRNDVITRLRSQYLDLSAREADWAIRFGQQHGAVQNLRNQIREIKTSISEEIKRIGETYKSDYEIAWAREQSVQKSLANLVSQAATTGQAQVKLRDLESSAQTARNLYDTFLQRSMEATQQQTFPITDARVITVATEPSRKSHPKSTIILAGAGFLGLFAGVIAAFVRSRLDRVFRTVTDVEEFTGHTALGIMPLVSASVSANARLEERHQVDPKRRIERNSGLTKYVIENAFSRAAETLRSVKVAIDTRGLTQEVRVIGFTSSVPREGKTTLAANLAQMVAYSGRRTILIDGDLRNPSLTKTLIPDAALGLIDVLSLGADEKDVIWTDPQTGLDVIPANVKGRIAHTAELISSKAMRDLLSRLKEEYDYVFVDLPPALPIVDVRATGQNIDGFIFVVEWGRTEREVVLETMKSADVMNQRVIGVILNKASPSALKRTEYYKGRYYQSYYK